MLTMGHLTSQNYLCKNFGVEEGRGHLGSLAGDYSTYNYSLGAMVRTLLEFAGCLQPVLKHYTIFSDFQ